eukprot:TRINITY_DN103418_c0_g1_i1.p1 TRINITY_DN103418_c0_g1~~TRINITY_DN103418_c0_g1_i1.p1  ORF type:complete len:262 (+),score=44.58 TRINITY_DN103418_c0_g1_i1:79-864(+)
MRSPIGCTCQIRRKNVLRRIAATASLVSPFLFCLLVRHPVRLNSSGFVGSPWPASARQLRTCHRLANPPAYADEENVLDLEALAAMSSEDDEENSNAEESWDAMIDKIYLEGDLPDATNFRAPEPVPSSYDAAEGFLQLDVTQLELELQAVQTPPPSEQEGDDAAGLEVWDVREPWEFDLGHLPRAKNVRFEALDEAATLRLSQESAAGGARGPVIICSNMGARSSQAQVRLHKVHGLGKVMSLQGGLAAWEVSGRPLVQS